MSTVFLPEKRRSSRPWGPGPKRILPPSIALGLVLGAAACAVRLGGPKPEEYRVLALAAAPGVDPEAVAERIQRADADVALLFGRADTTWFADIAARTALQLSGPGRSDGLGMAFLAGEAVGDTTLTLPVGEGPGLPVHDALYQVDENRYLDLMAVHLPQGVDPREAARALLSYVATDVMNGAAVVLAISADRPLDGAELARQLDPAFIGGEGCEDPASLDGGAPVRLLYGPALHIRCSRTRELDGSPWAVVADLIVRR